jgi:hypothetical protein
VERKDVLKKMGGIVKELKELDMEYTLKHTEFEVYSSYTGLTIE